MSDYGPNLDGSQAMGVAAFVAGTGRSARFASLKAEYDALLDPATGLVRADLTVSRLCPLCGAGSFRRIFVHLGFPHVRCNLCTMVYVNPILREDVQEEQHWKSSDLEDWMRVLLSEPQRRFDAEKFSYGLDLLRESVGPPGRLLDIGCGTGHFLEIARSQGWTGVGLELSPRMAEYARGLGLDVRREALVPGAFPTASFDAVTLWEVLDDIREPRDFMRQVAEILRPRGGLLILVPNIDSIAVRVMQEKSATFGGKGRINYFNIHTLSRLLMEAGFEIVRRETIISELETLNNYLNYLDPYQSEGAQPVLDLLTPEYIHERLLGYKLLVVGRRRA